MDESRYVERVEWSRVHVGGGAAIEVTVYDERRTLDVDAVVLGSDRLDEARLLAESDGIPPTLAQRERQAVGVLQQLLGVPDADVRTEAIRRGSIAVRLVSDSTA